MKNQIITVWFKLPVFLLIFFMLVSGVILGLSTGGFIIDFKQVGFSAISSVQQGVHAVTSTVSGTFSALHDLKELQKEYEILTEKLKDYEYLQRNNAEIRQENNRLREQLGLSESLNTKNYPAYIIARDPNSTYSSITINKGTRAGIKKNMPVIAIQHGIVGLVGKVIEVGLNTSKIMPVYDYHSNVSACIQKTRDVGLISGNGTEEQNLSLKYIKKQIFDELQYGDIIVTSGENGNYPKEIMIGSISNIEFLDYDSSLNIEIVPVIDFARLESVIVMDMKELND